MSNIRRQSIISSLVIYFGFGIGLLNIYLFTKQGLFLNTQFGLYNAFIAIATLMMTFASLGMPTYIYKFFPYYKSHLPEKKNDMMSIVMIMGLIGFLLVITAGIVFKQVVIKKYSTNAPEIVTYYQWIFPLGFGLLIFTLLEAYAWQFHRSIFTNFLKEVAWRLFTTVIIALFAFGWINFDQFIRIFSFSYPAIAAILLVYLFYSGQLHFVKPLSRVSKRFSKSIFRLCAFVYGGLIIFNLSLVFDSLVIGSVLDLDRLAIYSVGQSIAAIIQAPQRGIVAASMAHLSSAWREKNLPLIQKIYQRSSINQLIFAGGLYALIVLNFTDAVVTFHLKDAYLDAYYVVILLGLTKVVDMGTGVNSQIIATSTYWRFEFLSGVALLCLVLPLTYILTKEYGIVGTAIAQLVSITVYNIIRIIFLWRKFRLYPFSRHTLLAVLLAGGAYAASHYAFLNLHSWTGLFARSIVFILLYGLGTIYLRLSPDIQPVLATLKKRMGLKS